jgi:hypothetical protein
VRRDQRRAEGRRDERVGQVPGLAAGEVDEIGLADRLDVRHLLGVEPIPHENRLDLGSECREMLDSHRGPAPEDLFAVGPGGRGEERDPGPAAARRGEQARVDFLHHGQEFT